MDVPVALKGNAVTFNLPDRQGEFRGYADSDSRGIVGQWIQPTGIFLNNRYATPVGLARSDQGVWKGIVVPLEDRLTIYMVVQKIPDGSIGAFWRNPEFNLGMSRPFRVTDEAGDVTFVNARNTSDKFRGTYEHQTDHLVIRLPSYNATLDFTRRNREDALGFYPRTPAPKNYVPRQPISRSDGWATGSLRDVELDPKPIRALVERILRTETLDYTTPYIHSLLIARHGKLVLEEYFYGFDWSIPHDTRSAGKTLGSTLVGIAMKHGAGFELQTPVLSLFPEYNEIANLDARKKRITVKNLLTMTSGLAGDDNDDSSPGSEDYMQSQQLQLDWYKYALDLPMASEPGGEKAVYCSPAINLLGGIVRNTMGVWLPEFFYKHFAEPLDVHMYHLNLMPSNDAYMGGGAYLRPRDLLKLGQLYLSGGVWNGKRVVSESWVDSSTRKHSSFDQDHGYGFAWHIRDLTAGDHVYREYSAEGNGGQLLIVIPELDLVVGITAGNYGNFPTWYRFIQELVPQFIIPAASNQR
ncbi:MAG TPA: serine hydrolase [Candidatus Sulfotelmatobacter sp.]|nr:serine hydrolase [Candidatus Sulfotelmatobacter sp.]